jgi:hypothetical protein
VWVTRSQRSDFKLCLSLHIEIQMEKKKKHSDRGVRVDGRHSPTTYHIHRSTVTASSSLRVYELYVWV